MKTTWGFLAAALLTLMMATGSARADSPCCAVYDPCSVDEDLVKGATPGDSKCCLTADSQSCQTVYGAGYKCIDDPLDGAAAIAGGAGAGACGEATDEICFGGGFFTNGETPHGCFGFGGGNYFYANAPQTDPAGCTHASVEGCCQAGACE